MALTFGANTSDKVGCGAVLGTDPTAFTYLAWVYPTTITNGRVIIRKGSNSAGTGFAAFNISGAGTARLRCSIDYASTDADAHGANNTIAVNTWQCIACTFDGGIVAPKIFTGTLSALMAEISYTTQTGPISTRVTDGGGNLNIGQTQDGAAQTNAFQGLIAIVAIWDHALTLAELQEQQFHPHVTSGCVGLWHLGYNGTGTQPDFSGNGFEGTVTGATVGDHVPLTFRRSGALYVPYVAGGGSTFTITPAGVLVPTSVLIRNTSTVYLGGLVPAGVMARLNDKALVGAVTPTGADVLDTSKNVAGSAGSAGALIRGAQSTLNGFLDPSGALPRLVDKAVGGSVSLAGSISHAIAVVLAGVLTPIGTLAKDISVFLAGALTPSGTLATLRAVLVTLTGSIGLSGAITRRTDKGAGGSLAPSGGLGQDIAAILRGSITPSGSLGKLVSKFWSGVVGLAGTLAQVIGLVSPPTAIEITGSYIPALSVTGSYQTALSVTGNYSPALTITGAYET